MSGFKLIDTETLGGQILADVDLTDNELSITVRLWVESVTKYQDKKNSKWIDWIVRDMLRDTYSLTKYGYELEAKHTTNGQRPIFKIDA